MILFDRLWEFTGKAWLESAGGRDLKGRRTRGGRFSFGCLLRSGSLLPSPCCFGLALLSSMSADIRGTRLELFLSFSNRETLDIRWLLAMALLRRFACLPDRLPGVLRFIRCYWRRSSASLALTHLQRLSRPLD